MKKFFSFVLPLSTLLFMTSCFDILEEVTVKKDGSGQYTNRIDASKFAEQMQMFAAMDTTGEMIPKLKYSLDSTFSTTWSSYKKLSGISNVKIDTSKEYVYAVTFDFENMNALNAALNKDKSLGTDNLYSWEKGKLSRKDIPLNLNDLKTDDDQQKEMMKGFMQDMKYTIIFNLPNNIKNITNKSAKISDDKKTVTLECNMLEVMEGTVKLSNDVTYK